MKFQISGKVVAAVVLALWISSAQAIALTREIPACKEVVPRPLPDRYYELARKHKEFRWVNQLRASQYSNINGTGFELIAGSGMHDSYWGLKVDLNGDGNCDLILISYSIYSNAAGAESNPLNTFYIEKNRRWQRWGIPLRNPELPDCNGCKKRGEQTEKFVFFSEEPFFLYDKEQKRLFLIGVVLERDRSISSSAMINGHVGYRIYAWDNEQNRLIDLDRRTTGSLGYAVYNNFKEHGAALITGDDPKSRLQRFDPLVERAERAFLIRWCTQKADGLMAAGMAIECERWRKNASK